MAKSIRKRSHPLAGTERYERTFATLRARYPEYAKLFETTAAQNAFGDFMDYLDNKYKGLAYSSEEALSIMSTARFKIDMEILVVNYDLFSKDYDLSEAEEKRLRSLREVRELIGQADEEARQAEAGNWRDKRGRWHDKRGRFIKAPGI